MEENSYERIAYESVEDRWEPILDYISKSNVKKFQAFS